MTKHACEQRGHQWLLEDGRPYTRERGSDLNATVDVHCAHCPTVRALPRFSMYSGPRTLGQPIDVTIPPGILAATERALIDAAKQDPTRPTPKKRAAKKKAKKKTTRRPVQK